MATNVTTTDSLYEGRLLIRQNKAGYRFSIDAVLLAAFAQSGVDRTLDMGTGSGVVALQLWLENKSERFVGLDVQPSLLKLAKFNVQQNKASDRVDMVAADIRDRAEVKRLGSFDRVVANPPYWPLKAGRLPPNEEKAIAKHKVMGGLNEWLHAAADALEDGGVFETIYPVDHLPSLCERALHYRLTPIVLTLVHPRLGSPAAFCLLRCRKRSQTPLTVSESWWLEGDGAVKLRALER